MAGDKNPNPSFDKEKAEGSRETVEQALDEGRSAQQGVTNRPAAEESREQEQLPPRGEAKKPTPGGHA
jgi:hypothetical protein